MQGATKGQTEIVIILGIAVFATVAVFFALQSGILSQQPSGPGELKKMLHDKVEKEIYAGAVSVVEKMGKQGGNLDKPGTGLVFRGDGETKPYWEICEDTYIPAQEELAKNIEEGVRRVVNKMALNEFEGKKVEIGALDKVVADVNENDVVVRVWLPVSVEGYELEKLYTIRLNIPLGRVYNFASDFVKDNAKNRHLETFTASLFYHMNPDVMPTIDLLTGCGQSIYKNWNSLAKPAEKLLDYALANIIFWKSRPSSDKDYLEYYIPDVKGKKYEDLGMAFMRTEKLRPGNFMSDPSPVSYRNNKFINVMAPFCITEVDVRYSLSQPVVARITAPGNFTFDFAVFMYVSRSEIAKCSKVTEWKDIYNPCEDPKCDISVKVSDTLGRPLSGASVYFGGCEAGSTGDDGVLNGRVPCGIGEFVVYRTGYNVYNDVDGPLDITGKTVQLVKSPVIHFWFRRALVSHHPSPGATGSPDCKKEPLNINCDYTVSTTPVSNYVMLELKDNNPPTWDASIFYVFNRDHTGIVPMSTVGYVPPGTYSASCDLYENISNSVIKNSEALMGVTESGNFEIKEQPRNQDVYVFVPTFGEVPLAGFYAGAEYQTTPNAVQELCGYEGLSYSRPEYNNCMIARDPASYDTGTGACADALSRTAWLNPTLARCGLGLVDVTQNPCPEELLQQKLARVLNECSTKIIFR